MTKKNISRIKELRKRLNITQKDFAAKLDVTQGFISDLEVGRSEVSFKILKKLYELYAYNPLYHITGMGSIIVTGIYNLENNGSSIAAEPYSSYKARGLSENNNNLEKMQQLELIIENQKEEISNLNLEVKEGKNKIIALLEKLNGL